MKKIYKKYRLIHIINITSFSIILLLILLLHPIISIPIIILSFLFIISINITLEYILVSKQEKEMLEKEKEMNDKTETHFQDALKNVYDEHIFSITHELRSPLAVINASVNNQYNTIKNIYNIINIDDKTNIEKLFVHTKKLLKNINIQTEIIQSFISSIAEYGSYVSERGQKILNLHNYLLSIIINCKSYSRNMKVFSDNSIKFADNSGLDFLNIHCVVNPHDLSRILINILTNSADAVSSFYKTKKILNPEYEPVLKISCIKPKNKKNKMKLSEQFLRINCDSSDECQPFYLIIEDNGPGITKENITKIFKYGFSTKKDTDSSHLNHHGLGLYITLKLAALNDIKVYIKTDETGTMVVLGFPLIIYKDDIETLNYSEKLYDSYIIHEYENENYDNNLNLFNAYKKTDGFAVFKDKSAR